MALTQKEKDRIIEEEKVRMEARKDYYTSGYCGRWGSGCHGGWGFFKLVFAVLILYAIFHCWHRSNCGTSTCSWGTSSTTTTTSAPVAPPAKPAVSAAKPVVRPVKAEAPPAKPAVAPAKPTAPPVTQ